MPKVSVIVPIYAVEAYLSACVDSVLNQTMGDYELILVDDGSPDGSGALCDSYAARDSRIRVLHKKNGGLSDARNAGLDVATGTYIYFLDGDDTIEPTLLETVTARMDQGYDLVAFSTRGFYDDGTVLPPWHRETGIYDLQTPEKRKDFIHRTLLQTRIGWEACTRMFSGAIIRRHGLRFADNRRIFAEDLHFSLCYCAHAEKIISISDCLYNYRQRRDSIMGQQTVRNNMDRICLLADAVEAHYENSEDCIELADNFSMIRYQILMNQAGFQLLNVPDQSAFRQELMEKLGCWPEISDLLKEKNKSRGEWKAYYSPLRYYEVIQNTKFLLDGNVERWKRSAWLIQKIRNLQERIDRISGR